MNQLFISALMEKIKMKTRLLILLIILLSVCLSNIANAQTSDIDSLGTDYPFLYHVEFEADVYMSGEFYYYNFEVFNNPINEGIIISFDINLRDTLSYMPDTTNLRFKHPYMKNSFERMYRRIKGFVIPVGFLQSPGKWSGAFSKFGDAGFGGSPVIEPGDSLSGFVLQSRGLPKIRVLKVYPRFEVEKYFQSLDDPNLTQTFEEMDSLRNMVNYYGFTLGPWLPDSTLSLNSFTDTLETFRYRSCEELGWATDAAVCGQLEENLSQVKISLLAKDSVAAANALSNFIELVELEKDASLTSEGYALLFFNAEYLAERLPEPLDEPEGSGITCECANPVTQSSGQIRFTGGETRCLAGEFSGSVFFQQSGRLEVCGNATFQNISGNNTGTVAVSETGVVSIQNWNNNNTADSLINWGSMEFRNQVNVNRGQLINHGQLTVNGGLNQNNGSLTNSGTLTVNRAMNLNQPGTMNTGILSVGQRLTLNSNASLINECRVSVNGPIQLNGTISMEAGSFLQSGGRVTINSQGVLALNGENTMAWLDALRLNGAIESNGDNQLLYSESNIQTNNSAQINSQGELLQVSAPNLSGLIANYPIADGTNAVIPTSSCNPIGFNNE
jgi:hypothetical protein